MAEAAIEVQHLMVSFARGDEARPAILDLSLRIERGSFVALVGPSGCGKSTLLNVIAGLVRPSAGTVRHNGRVVNGPNTQAGYLTQRDTFMPWRDVLSNVQMPLEFRPVSASERRARARELLARVGLAGFEHYYPRELSGGMLRRASLARLLTVDPDTLLMDEPFGALDAQLRLQMQDQVLSLWSGTGKTVVFVTHDIEEAIVLADRVVVLGVPGRVVHDEPVGLERPRDPVRIRFSPAFASIHERLWDALPAPAVLAP